MGHVKLSMTERGWDGMGWVNDREREDGMGWINDRQREREDGMNQ
jgi:hypothetical protein